MPETVTFFDLETTGVDVATSHIVEFAALKYAWPLDIMRDSVLCLVNPGIPIPPEASAVHHLVDANVAGATTEAELAEKLDLLGEHLIPDAVCGHNIAAYDLPISQARLHWPDPGVPVLDTMRLAQHVWPDLPSYKLEVLAYRFDLHPSEELVQEISWHVGGVQPGSHSAGYDCLLCVNLLRRIVAESGVDTLAGLEELSASPITVRTMRFWKHSGQPVADLPRDYVAWLLKQPWLATDHPDLLHTLAPQTGK